ncbi:hypothetical protein [Vibrio hippocampi]|uniref:HsdR n=1 Tax=Vibrio hippocampi TaxID=654686 RepID=A0ABN8DFZ6_9VIBR|nr:hypothetical protein [Vibrio hippocampi]CAH0525450.1 hypothetical protein VHP8226_00981 [Vibrio hippocampi]
MSKSKIPQEMFQHVVNNALDFLEQSIDELQQKPKYSVIHFHAAIELVLKARLMSEHWSLVVSPKKQADWQEFTQGKFVSVTLEEAATRLEKVAQSGLGDKQLKSFRAVTKHRNQMVHFYHAAETEQAGIQRIQAIVKEQLSAWYFLHDLMLGQWKETFNDWEQEISEIDAKLREHHEFLKVVFEALKPKIKEQVSEGYVFHTCPSCGFESDRHPDERDSLYESKCLVCGLNEQCILIECTECEEGEALYRGIAEAECSSCGHHHDGSQLLEKFVDDGAAYMAVKDGGDYPFPLNCGECMGYETVVEVADAQYLCTECFAVSDTYGVCGWCSDESTNLSEDSYWRGCEFCDGRAGWDKD